jgi:hypothetical protein
MFASKLPTAFREEFHWRTVTIDRAQEVVGVVAGPIVCIDSHYDTVLNCSKPCRRCLTEGALPCTRGKNCTPREIGYLPVWEKTTQAGLVVLVSRTVCLKHYSLPIHEPIRISRPDAGNNPALRIHPLTGEDARQSVFKSLRARPRQDIKPYLLHLWQDRTLCDFYGVPFVASVKTADQTQ